MEWIHQVLGKIVRTFNIRETNVDQYNPLSGILAAAAFTILSTTNSLQSYSTGQLVFCSDIILQIKIQGGFGINMPAKSGAH